MDIRQLIDKINHFENKQILNEGVVNDMTEGGTFDEQELSDVLKAFDEQVNEIGGNGIPDYDKIISALDNGDIEAAMEEIVSAYSDQDGGEIRSNEYDNYLEDLESEFKFLVYSNPSQRVRPNDESDSDTNIRPGMRVSQGTVVKVDGNDVIVKTSNGDMMTMNIHDVDQAVAEGGFPKKISQKEVDKFQKKHNDKLTGREVNRQEQEKKPADNNKKQGVAEGADYATFEDRKNQTSIYKTLIKEFGYSLDEAEEFQFSPEQEKFLGKANRQDPYILAKMPGPKPPFSYFKDPEDQAIAKQMNFGANNLNKIKNLVGAGTQGDASTFAAPAAAPAAAVATPVKPQTPNTATALPAAAPAAAPGLGLKPPKYGGLGGGVRPLDGSDDRREGGQGLKMPAQAPVTSVAAAQAALAPAPAPAEAPPEAAMGAGSGAPRVGPNTTIPANSAAANAEMNGDPVAPTDPSGAEAQAQAAGKRMANAALGQPAAAPAAGAEATKIARFKELLGKAKNSSVTPPAATKESIGYFLNKLRFIESQQLNEALTPEEQKEMDGLYAELGQQGSENNPELVAAINDYNSLTKSAPAAAPTAPVTPVAAPTDVPRTADGVNIANMPAGSAAASAYKGNAGAQEIQKLNPAIKDVNKIYAGQKFKMPDGSTYTVKPGDTLDKIAKGAKPAGEEATKMPPTKQQDRFNVPQQIGKAPPAAPAPATNPAPAAPAAPFRKELDINQLKQLSGQPAAANPGKVDLSVMNPAMNPANNAPSAFAPGGTTSTQTNTSVQGELKMGKPSGPITFNGKQVQPGAPEYAAASAALIKAQGGAQSARSRNDQNVEKNLAASGAPVSAGAPNVDRADFESVRDQDNAILERIRSALKF